LGEDMWQSEVVRNLSLFQFNKSFPDLMHNGQNHLKEGIISLVQDSR
jgi:hypothetical protein